MTQSRVRYQLAASLDGFIGPPDGGVAWLDPYEPVARAMMGEFLAGIGGVVVGRRTWEQMRTFGPTPIDETPTVVLTSEAGVTSGSAAVACSDGPDATLSMLRDRMTGGDIWLLGGGVTAGSFLAAGLIDRVELTIVPVVLGAGKAMFTDVAATPTLELVSAAPGDLGTVTLVYARRLS